MKIDPQNMLLLRKIQRLDISLFSWVLARPQFDLWLALAKPLSRSADGFLYPLIALLLYWQGLPAIAAAMAVAFALERPVYWLLKNSCRRFRPPETLPGVVSAVVPSDRFSLPSGHTSGAFLTATIISAAFPALSLPCYLWAVGIGWSRICLGVHFPTDTAVGALLGITCAQWALGQFISTPLF